MILMKNVQVVDGADNCTYSIFSIDDADFCKIFPDDQDVEFSKDFIVRVGESESQRIYKKLWENIINKKDVSGIHGTLFFNLDNRKVYYPTKRESEMEVVL